MADNRVPLVGASEKEIITYYFTIGFEYYAIIRVLYKFNQINISLRTLKSGLKQYNLRRRLPTYDIALVRDRILSY